MGGSIVKQTSSGKDNADQHYGKDGENRIQKGADHGYHYFMS